jgi:hypothetical protein
MKPAERRESYSPGAGTQNRGADKYSAIVVY